ncbi:hypothetical protein B5F40_08000 [Gordonibacter sp. An230]|uniref:SLC13 family permease n=1 Tax=Gordonibacter sp. An230 TaxID=1965592 RepID=UPI000B383B0F|nr:SLC13 family permease [Gordonibacter sp. An230]OUO90165.1 hypothetical protein B5F40_08000 [Gordonibacter sp. An230]
MDAQGRIGGLRFSKKAAIQGIMTFGVPFLLFLIPTNETFTPVIQRYFVITSMAVMTFCFGNVPQTAVAILLPVSYVIFGVAQPSDIYSVWAGDTIWMILGGIILAAILQKSGLLKRIAYKCIILTGASYRGIIVGLGLASIVLTIIMPGQGFMAVAPLSYGICKALHLGKGKDAAGIMLSGAVLSLSTHFFLYNPHTLVVFGVGEQVTGPLNVTWGSYFMNNCISIVFFLLLMGVCLLMFKPSKPLSGKEYFVGALADMGKMQLQEKKCIAVSVLLVALLVTQPLHGVSAGWIFTAVPMLLFLPGIAVGDSEDLKKIDYGFIFFIGACMAIGSSTSSLGIGDIIADIAIPALQDCSATLVLFVVYVLCFLLNFIMTPLAIWSAFAVPFVSITNAVGIDPQALFFLMYHATDQVIMPYEYAYYLLFFSFGLIPLKEFVKIMGVKTILNAVFVFAILIPFWNLIGFLMA